MESGAARARDLHDLAEVAGFMKDHGYCAHSRTAAASVTGLLARFRGDVEAHLARRALPAARRAPVRSVRDRIARARAPSRPLA